jgi:hypothetical protein
VQRRSYLMRNFVQPVPAVREARSARFDEQPVKCRGSTDRDQSIKIKICMCS